MTHPAVAKRVKPQRCPLVIIMGVSGTGKSSVAKNIAQSMDCDFVEADDFHSVEAKAMMANNIALTERERGPWINAICQHLMANKHKPQVLAYSGLKRAHRQKFRELDFDVLFFWLNAEADIIAKRIAERQGHFVDAAFLEGQITAFECPLRDEVDLVEVDVKQPFVEVIMDIMEHLGVPA